MMARKKTTLAEIASLVGGTVKGDGKFFVFSVRPLLEWEEGSISPVWDRKLLAKAPEGSVLLAPPLWIPEGATGVETIDVRRALCLMIEHFSEPDVVVPGVHPAASIDPSARIAPSASIGPFCVVEADAVVGEGSRLGAHGYIGRKVVIGNDCRIAPQVVLLEGTQLGNRVLIHSGAVLGADGFGFIPVPGEQPIKMPQAGCVSIEDDVEIGACCTVDRGTLGITRIGSGSKLDDHVHVGHNARVGRNCLMVAFSGLAGSSSIGDGVVLAARSGLAEHVSVGEGTQIAACSGVTKDVPAGCVVSGFPAQDHKTELRTVGLVRRLPDLMERMSELEREMATLRRVAKEGGA